MSRRAWRQLYALAAASAVGVVACGFSQSLPSSSPSDGGPPDMMVVVPCDAPTLSCANGTTLRASCTGTSDVDMACPWGCLDDAPGPRCGALVPGGGEVEPADLDPTGLVDLSLTGTVDGTDGEINGTAAASMMIPHRVDGDIAVFRVKTLTITGPLKLTGDSAIAFVASGEIRVEGVVDARGSCNDGAGRTAGPGGHDGGDIESNGSGTGRGTGTGTQDRGGGGGGHGANGGDGVGPTAGGVAFGDPAITTLVGGSGGGGGKTSRGGGGGGAVQLVSNVAITVASGAGINAGGCGGPAGTGVMDAGGGGGGAGGAILLEAPRITIAGTLAVNGGTGGDRQAAGSAGRLDRTAAAGPPNGGAGGAGGVFAGANGTGAGNNAAHGGGGGGVGRIRFHTGTGAQTELALAGATLSPDLDDGAMTTTTHARAAVQ